MKQNDAVRAAITGVMGSFEGSVKEIITAEQKASVRQILFEGFQAGTIDLKVSMDEAALKVYVGGLLSNWLRKDKALNGGVKYVPKNPGSRVGAGDNMLKQIRALKASLDESHPEYATVVQAEATRIAELTAMKTTKTVKAIDFSALPAELQAKFAK